MMTFFNVQLMTPQGEVSFQCPDDEYILDAAEQAGIDMSYSCRAGACSSCVGRLVQGTLDQTDDFAPQFHAWCDSKQSWIELDPKVPQMGTQG